MWSVPAGRYGPAMRTAPRVLAAAVTTALAATLLQVAAPVAHAQTRTFTPASPQEYLTSTTVISRPGRWRFEIRTPRFDDVGRYRWAIDTPGPHTHAGAEYLLSSDLGKPVLRKLPNASGSGSYVAPCPGTKRGLLPLKDGVPTGIWVSLPQDCLTYYATDDARVRSVRVRVAVDGTDSTSYSPGRGARVFHGPVANHPGAL